GTCAELSGTARFRPSPSSVHLGSLLALTAVGLYSAFAPLGTCPFCRGQPALLYFTRGGNLPMNDAERVGGVFVGKD
ncbi:MAG TPA: hypothetical protein VKU80_12360, partial [Planctomycetota bacterium]|nr:hypothetical protein [Planctomycetota bacterium]